MTTSRPTLVVTQVWRKTVDGNVEALNLSAGVNLIVGGPNTGKTKWLETIDYMLGDTGEDPYSAAATTSSPTNTRPPDCDSPLARPHSPPSAAGAKVGVRGRSGATVKPCRHVTSSIF